MKGIKDSKVIVVLRYYYWNAEFSLILTYDEAVIGGRLRTIPCQAMG